MRNKIQRTLNSRITKKKKAFREALSCWRKFKIIAANIKYEVLQQNGTNIIRTNEYFEMFTKWTKLKQSKVEKQIGNWRSLMASIVIYLKFEMRRTICQKALTNSIGHRYTH